MDRAQFDREYERVMVALTANDRAILKIGDIYEIEGPIQMLMAVHAALDSILRLLASEGLLPSYETIFMAERNEQN